MSKTSKDDNKNGLGTVLSDARFYNCSHGAYWCFTSYIDFFKCKRLLGKEYEACEQFKKIYETICPNDWIRKWDDQRETGTFPVDLPPEKETLGEK